MTDPRKPVFDAVRAICPGNVFNSAENINALHNLLDAFKDKREVPMQFAMRDPAKFFGELRKTTGALNQTQVDTISLLLTAASQWSVGWLAYALATAWHEARFISQFEKGGPGYLAKYDTGELAKRLGNTPEADGDGIKFAGRGLVQLTGTTNYRNAGKYLGIDLIANPDLALDPAIATKILIWGMQTGAFTGRKLADYIGEQGNLESFRQARRIINGMDRAGDIAGYAIAFQQAVLLGKWG